MDIKEALDILYGEESRDLDPEGYLDAITRLRDQDPNLAKRVETAVEPTLDEKVFTRSQISWHESSLDTAHRVALLRDNPHFRRYVNAVRRVLAIPAGHGG